MANVKGAAPVTATVTRSYKEQVKPSDPHGIEALDLNEKYLALLKGYDGDRKRSSIGLFISQLRSAANSNKKPDEAYRYAYYYPNITDAYESTKNESLGNVKFVNELPWMKDNDPMYDDWVNFFCNLGKRLGGTALDAHAITFINNLYKLEKSHPDEYAFAVAVVKTFVEALTNAKSVSVHDDITKWATATKGTYYTKENIINSLFPENIEFKTPFSLGTYAAKTDVPTTEINKAIKDAFKQTPHCPEVYSFDKYRYNLYAQKILASIMDDVKEEVDTLTTETVITSPFLDSISQHMSKPQQPTKKYRYIRKADKVLYIVTKDGKEIPADNFIDTNEGDLNKAVCTTTGVNDPVMCDEFFNSCIGGRNLGDCKRFLIDHNFWVKGIQSFLDELNLYLAHKAFIKYKIPTTTRSGVRVYVSTAEWHKKLEDMLKSGNSDGLTQTEIDQIKSNSQLNAIIDMTVDQINSWPAILNEDVIEELEERKPQSGGSLTKLYLIGGHGAQLHPTMPRPLVAPGSIHGITVGKVGTLQQSFLNILNLLPKIVQSMPGMPNISTVPFLSSLASQPRLASGSPINLDTYNIQSNEFFYLYNRINVLIKSIDAGLPQWLETTFNIHKSVLDQRGIKVASDDLKSINQVIERLKEVEKIILTALKGMSKYALFFQTDLSPAIMSLTSGDPAEDKQLETLNKLHSKTADQMLRMGEIATKKIDTYCSKSTKVGGICDQIALLK
jgi:hypothetical protein